ncbi:MAG: hypothetical protein OXH68_14595 [Gammaproteobacteria bacterium]|nr:hypothetical protein [Gammaproteobacteria bacterium]
MQAVESFFALVVAVILANAAYQTGAAYVERSGIAADVRAVLAIGVRYQATACDSRTIAADVGTMGAALVAAGANVTLPKQPRRWTVRYAGTRTATSAADPLRTSGVRMRAELANASVVERGVIRSMGGWVDGTSAMLVETRPVQGPTRIRRARLARGLTAAERASGC